MAVVGSARLGSPLDLRSSVQQPARLPHQSAAAARSNGGLSLPSSTSRAVSMVSQPPSSRTSVTSAAAPAAPFLQRTIEDTTPASPMLEGFDGTGPTAASRDIISEMFPDYDADAMRATTGPTQPLDPAAIPNHPSTQPSSGSSSSSSDDTDRPYQAAKQRWESDRLILHVAHAAPPSTSPGSSWISTLLSSVRGQPASPRLTPEQQELIQTAVTGPAQRRRRQRHAWTPSDEAATGAEEGEQEPASGGWQGGSNGAAGLQKEVEKHRGTSSANSGARVEGDRASSTASAAPSEPSAGPATAAAPPQSPLRSEPAAAQASQARSLSTPRQRMGAPGVAPELSHLRRQSLDQLMGILDGVGLQAAPRGLPVNMPRSVQQLLFCQELRQQESTRPREQTPLWPQAEGQGQRPGQTGDEHDQGEAREQEQEQGQGQGQGHPGAGQGGSGSSLSPAAPMSSSVSQSASQTVSHSASRPSPTSTSSSSSGMSDVAGPSSGSGVEERWTASLSPTAPGAEHGKGTQSAVISAGPDMILSVASTGAQATARSAPVRSSSSGSGGSGDGSSGSGRSGEDGGVARGSSERESVGRAVGAMAASVENPPINPSRDSMDPLALASMSDSSDDETEGAGHGLEGTQGGPREVGFDAAGTGGASTSGGGSAADRAGAGYGAARGGQGSYYRLRSGARGYFLQHASWLLERNPDLQSFLANPSPRQQGALAKMNKLLVEHAMSPSSTWTDVCRAVREYGDWMDPISLSCMLQVLARKGPTPWRLGLHWAAQNGYGAASHQRPFLPVLEPSLGQKRDQQLLRRTLSQLLRMISGRANQFPSQAAASSLHALSLLTTRHETPVIHPTQPPTAPGSSSAAPAIPTALFNPQRRSASIDALCSALLLRLSEPHTRPTPRALAVALYACARMGVGPPGVSLGPLLKVVCAVPLERFSTREFVTVGAALVQLSQFPSLAWMQSYEREAVRRMGEVSGSDLLLLLKATVTYWAAQPPQTQGQRQPLPSREYMNALLAALFAVLPQFQPYQIAGVMVCLAHMGYTPSSAWLGKLQVQVIRTCFAFSPKELSLVLGALARLKPQSPLFWDPSYEAGHTSQQQQGQVQRQQQGQAQRQQQGQAQRQGQGQGQLQGQGQREKQHAQGQGQGSSASSSADGSRGVDVTDTPGSSAALTTLQQLLASMGLTRERPDMLAGNRAARASPQASSHQDQRHQQASTQHRSANGLPPQSMQQQQPQQQGLPVQGGFRGYVLLQEEMLVAAAGLFAAPHNQRGLGGRTGSRFLGALATLVERLPAADAERARARLAPALMQMLPTVSRLAAARAHAVASGPALRAGGHSATSSTRAAGDVHSWPKRRTAGERQADESAKEVSLDLFQTIQMTVALLNLLGRQLPPGFMRTMEHAMVVQLQQEQEAPHSMRPAPSSSWRELAAAYERAGLAAGSPELARLMLLLA